MNSQQHPNILLGYTLSALSLPEIGELERHFKVQHLAEAAEAATMTSKEAGEVIIRLAMNDNAAGVFKHGTAAYAFQCLIGTNLPKLLALSLRRHHPDITPAKAAALLTPENQMAVHAACLDMADVPMPSEEVDASAR